MEETLSSTNTYTKQQWIAKQARKHPERVFTSLHHLIDFEWMVEAYRRTRKDGAAGIDGVTGADYEKDLKANLEDLLNRIKTGRYVAPPVRRHYIPKADGTKRPLGIPTFEDKVAQRAILMMLEPIYETDFLPCSYGFRRGRSAHDALDALRKGIIEQRQRWVIDADVAKYFDNISFTHLRSFLDLRIRDGVVRRMIDKWLKAGVLVHAVASALISESEKDLGDIRTGAAAHAGELADIALTLHRIKETRELGLELFERLMDARSYGLDDRIAAIDRVAFR